ncbi:hypothetical protein [Halosimplex pelagicum]|uniref:HEAT repeat domain-containing protein n=1 Tax=Halosimplex pelagicum TaxID=869886 RepID=A0A7D5P9P8_9EURY|nr:hypothetical protein [Halosimplex pelagicum]QLH84217.1 hypothetical protein HZS54_22395 [Halosimplex pelagicum]
MTEPVVGFAERVTGTTPDDRAAALAALREESPDALGAGLSALFRTAATADDPSDRRLALDAAYPVVAEVLASLDELPPALFAALDDEATRLHAAAVVRELDPRAETVRSALSAAEPARRAAAARYLEVVGRDDPLVEALEAALTDEAADVRAAAAGALCRAIERSQCNSDTTVPERLRATVPALADAATADPDPRVRRDAAVAVGSVVMIDDEVATETVATGARAFGRAVLDDDERVRSAVLGVVDAQSDLAFRVPDPAVRLYAVGLAEAATEDAPAPERARVDADAVAKRSAELPGSAVADLVERGWEAASPSPYARDLVAALATERPDAVAERAGRIRDGVERGVGVGAGARALDAVEPADGTAVDATFAALRGSLSSAPEAAPSVAERALDAGRADEVAEAVRRAVVAEPSPDAVEALVTLSAGSDGGTAATLFDLATDDAVDDDARLAAASGCATLLWRGDDPAVDATALVDVLAGFLATPDDGRRSTAADALAAVGRGAADPDPAAAAFADGGAAEDDEPLAVLAEAAPSQAATVIEALVDGLVPGEGRNNTERLNPVVAAVDADPAVGTSALPSLLTAMGVTGADVGFARVTAAEILETVATAEPAAVVPLAGDLPVLLADGCPSVRTAGAAALAAAGDADPDAVPERLRALSRVDRDDERWPMGVVVRDAPKLAERALADTLSFRPRDETETAEFVASIARSDRELATDAVEWVRDLLWAGVEVKSAAEFVGALAERDADLAARCAEAVAANVDAETPRWERRAAIRALAAVAEQRPEVVRAAFDGAVDESPAAYREAIFWQFEDDVDELFDAAGIGRSAGSGTATDGRPDCDRFWAELDERI